VLDVEVNYLCGGWYSVKYQTPMGIRLVVHIHDSGSVGKRKEKKEVVIIVRDSSLNICSKPSYDTIRNK
jgi:hypothetical protein